jgi:hypothetical protein
MVAGEVLATWDYRLPFWVTNMYLALLGVAGSNSLLCHEAIARRCRVWLVGV